jgi:hypothetical protein
MITHLVLLKPRPDLTTADRRALVAAFERAIREIHTVRGARIGTRVTHGADSERTMPDTGELMVVLDFDDLEGLQTYLRHTAHAELGALFGISLTSALVYDYEVGDLQLLQRLIQWAARTANLNVHPTADLEINAPHDEPWNPAHNEHHQGPHLRHVDNRGSAVDGREHVSGHPVGSTRKRWLRQALSHRRPHEAGFDADDAQTLASELVIQTFEIPSKPAFGRAIENDRFSAPLARHGAEDTQRAPTVGQQTGSRLLAEEHGVGKINDQQSSGELEVLLEMGLSGEEAGGDNNRIEPAKLLRSLVERPGKTLRLFEIADRIADGDV